MADEDAVQITRHRRLLEALRSQEAQKDESISGQSGTGVGSRYAEDRTGGDRQDTRGNNPNVARDAGGAQRTAKVNGTSAGLRQGVRPPDRPHVNANKGAGTSGRGREEPVTEEKKEGTHFRIRNPLNWREVSSAQLFTKAEAEEEYERMYEIYFYGWGLVDDVLEIIIKGHEPVQIWQLSEDEAETMARMHLQRATRDKQSAQSARQLLALYDRLYTWILALPRMKATASLVKEKGLSFK